MAGLKEIKRRLRSVNNTRKITYAMKLVSSAKLKRAQEAVTSFRIYRSELDVILTQVQAALDDASMSHPLMAAAKETRSICLLVVGGQRGLCGGYNHNLHRKVESLIREKLAANPKLTVDSYLIGKKVAEYFRRVKRPAVRAMEDLTENVNSWPLDEISRDLQEAFLTRRYDEVWLIYTRFRSVISQTPVAEKLLPLDVKEGASEPEYSPEMLSSGTVFEPSRAELFSEMLPRVVNSRIRQACLDAKASETGSRMTAMDAATRNAGQLARKLELTHNKIRQNRITSELLDIVGGAEATK